MKAPVLSERGGSSLRRLALGLAALVSALILTFSWTMSEIPARAPAVTVLLTLDRTWFHRLALSRFTYVRALERAGAQVRVFDDSALADGEQAGDAARRLLQGVDALVLSGGGDVDPVLYGGDRSLGRSVRPQRDRFELALLDEADKRRLPILGICRGAQLLNVARGGTLRTIRADRELRRRHARLRAHAVELEAGSRLAKIFGVERLDRVVSYHGQAVESPGDGLRVVGRGAGGVAEAIESVSGAQGAWTVGVQWHPELSPRSVLQRKLFTGLVESAREARDSRPTSARDVGLERP